MIPKILQGTRDFLPLEMAKRQFVLQKIVTVFARFGYDALETPAIEYAETILGKYGNESEKLTYRFQDNGGRNIALRYDQTVPFARVIAANYKNLVMPFKRYQIGRVWRGDRPLKGRYREFYQCDIDIIGTNSLVAEAEIAQIIKSVFTELGFNDFIIKFNSRRLMNEIMNNLNISVVQQVLILKELDKLVKIGLNKTILNLQKIIPHIALDLIKIINLTGNNNEKIQQLKNYNTSEITKFINLCHTFGIKNKNIELDLSLARGLDYYTGLIYEVFIPNVNIGAVGAGGRYDDLCGLFTNENFSGVGVAFGFDRIILAMEELKMLDHISLNSRVLVTYFSEATLNDAIAITNELQAKNIKTEIYLEPNSLKKQLKYAHKKQIPFVIFCGPEEIANKELKIRFMKNGKEKIIPRNQVSIYLTSFYEGN